MIISFADKDAERLARLESVPRFKPFERIALRKLAQLDVALRLDDLRVPSVIAWSGLREIGKVSIPFGLMINTASVSLGLLKDPKMLKSVITTEKGDL